MCSSVSPGGYLCLKIIHNNADPTLGTVVLLFLSLLSITFSFDFYLSFSPYLFPS